MQLAKIGKSTSSFVLLHLCVSCTFLQASVSPTLCSSVLSSELVGSSSSVLGPTATLSNSYVKIKYRHHSLLLQWQVRFIPWRCKISFLNFLYRMKIQPQNSYIKKTVGLFLQTKQQHFLSCRLTFISMRMSEGSEALWLHCGGQDVTLSLPCFLLGVVDCSWVTNSTEAPASTASLESGATGLPTAFSTRSYLLFHSRLIRADKETERKSKMGVPREA